MDQSERSEVGFRRPPKEHQFKKGKSGNPNGRPKGTSFEALFEKALAKKIDFPGQGRISVRKAVVVRVLESAIAKGDRRMLLWLIEQFPGPGADGQNMMKRLHVRRKEEKRG